MTSSDLTFSDRLLAEIDRKQSFIVVGLDPQFLKIPRVFKQGPVERHGLTLTAAAEGITAFNRAILDAVSPYIAAVKPQIAFYEMYGLPGLEAFAATAEYARAKGLLVIGDVKRNDIGHTAGAYADAFLGTAELDKGFSRPVFDLDAVTINPYLGSDGIKPFISVASRSRKGIFVLVKTSNQSSSELQDLVLEGGRIKLYERVGELVDAWGREIMGRRGYSSVGAVVGATFPEHAEILRKIMPKNIFLVPGYGSQGGAARDVLPCFNEDGYGAIINASRSLNYPHGQDLSVSENSFQNLVKTAVDRMNNDINEALKVKGCLPW